MCFFEKNKEDSPVNLNRERVKFFHQLFSFKLWRSFFALPQKSRIERGAFHTWATIHTPCWVHKFKLNSSVCSFPIIWDIYDCLHESYIFRLFVHSCFSTKDTYMWVRNTRCNLAPQCWCIHIYIYIPLKIAEINFSVPHSDWRRKILPASP